MKVDKIKFRSPMILINLGSDYPLVFENYSEPLVRDRVIMVVQNGLNYIITLVYTGAKLPWYPLMLHLLAPTLCQNLCTLVL